MKPFLLIFSVFLFSCNNKPKNKTIDFKEKIVDFAIQNSNDQYIELPNLYDSISKQLVPKDEDEKLLLAQILKKKGFKITNWGRGNHPLGPRFIALTLKKDSCECEIDKIYYSTDNVPDSIYTITEKIKCKKIRH
jgi:hypothetical protein